MEFADCCPQVSTTNPVQLVNAEKLLPPDGCPISSVAWEKYIGGLGAVPTGRADAKGQHQLGPVPVVAR